MELNEIRYFLAVSQTRNFTRAAEQCRVSQPALTRAIRKMEDELGGLLFFRERNNTHLTRLGELVLPHLAEAMTRTEAAGKTASSFLNMERAQLAVGMMSSVAPSRFVGFLGHFRSRNPGVEMILKTASAARLSDLLLRGELDLAVMAREDGFPAPMNAMPLYEERYVVGCAENHRLAAMTEVPVGALDGEHYFARADCELSDRLPDICREQGVALRESPFRSECEHWTLSMVAEGFGICFMPEFAALFPGVTARRVSGLRTERTICLVTIAGRRASPPVDAFTTALRRYSCPAFPAVKSSNL